VETDDGCIARDIPFCFMETGTIFIKDGKEYNIRRKQEQNLQACKSGMNHQGRGMAFDLRDSLGLSIPEENLYKPHYAKKCGTYSFRIICNGCSNCGGCEEKMSVD